jgi:hypothetical protein
MTMLLVRQMAIVEAVKGEENKVRDLQRRGAS